MLHFKLADEKWLDFICDNQSGKLTGEYDIVIGPVADDRVYSALMLAQLFNEERAGRLSLPEV